MPTKPRIGTKVMTIRIIVFFCVTGAFSVKSNSLDTIQKYKTNFSPKLLLPDERFDDNGKANKLQTSFEETPFWMNHNDFWRQISAGGHDEGSSPTKRDSINSPKGYDLRMDQYLPDQSSDYQGYPYFPSSCPATCQCAQLTVKCKSGYWRQIPALPNNFTHFVMQNSNITVLEKASFSQIYHALTNVNLEHIQLTTIQVGAFEKLPSLQALHLPENKLTSLPTEVFSNLSSLNYLVLSYNNFVHLPHSSICVARKLFNLVSRGNKVTKLQFPQCYLNMSRLHVLDLAHNSIAEVDKDDFFNLRYSPVKLLGLNNCKLKRLKGDTFTYLTKLTTLNLSDNKINTFPKNIFRKLSSLSLLDVSHNLLQIVAPLWFVNSIKTFSFAFNSITALNVSESISFDSVRSLNLENNELNKLEPQIFARLGLFNVEDLILTRCALKNIYANAFHNLTKLKYLSLSGNPLTAIGIQQGLNGLSSHYLQKLSLDSTNLRDINNDTFVHLVDNQITKLILDSNGIEAIPAGTFRNFGQLRSLSLKHNRIMNIDNGCFRPLVSLDSLFLTNNHLVYCIDHLHSGLNPGVTIIDMSSNLIQRIDTECVAGLHELKRYELYDNKLSGSGLATNAISGTDITSLDLSNNQITVLANSTLNNMTSLEILYLSNNKIDKIETGCFEGLRSVNQLDLAVNPLIGNHLDDLHITFADLPSLHILDLSSCGIKNLPVNFLISLSKLQMLTLSNNAIISWEPDFFINQNILSVLHLRRNKIVTINSTSIQNLPALKEIYLDFNPYICTCNLRDFQNWILSGRFFVDINLNDDKSYVCVSPPAMKGVSLIYVDFGFWECGPIDAIIGGSVGGFAFVLLVVFSVISYRYRWYIRYGCFLLKGRLRQRRNQERLIECTYDAFVSYNHGDQRWVIEHLLPELEYRGNIRLCLHDRDWLAGPDVADNIMDSIENSHKTILILSNHFVQSQWCQLEMSMAQHKLLTSQKDVLVLVLKDPIDDCYMTSRLRHLMTTQTYLAWDGGDPQKVRRFWKALRQSVKPDRAV